MTAYNRQEYITEAIESVLASTYRNFELIISDDCSKDMTVEVARKMAGRDTRIKIFQNESNLGDYSNRNKAASYANGKYIKYLDSDDLMYAHCLQVMVSAMEKFPEAGFGLSAKADIEKPYPQLLSSRETYLEHFNGYGHFDRAPGSAIIRKDAFDKVGGFSGERMIGDFDLWFRLSLYYPMAKVVADLYWSRMHPGQESQSSYAREQYKELRKMVMERYYNHPQCPLKEDEKKAIQLRMKRKQKWGSVLNVVNKVFR